MDIQDFLKSKKRCAYTNKEISLMMQKESKEITNQLKSLEKHDIIEKQETEIFGRKRTFYRYKY